MGLCRVIIGWGQRMDLIFLVIIRSLKEDKDDKIEKGVLLVGYFLFGSLS